MRQRCPPGGVWRLLLQPVSVEKLRHGGWPHLGGHVVGGERVRYRAGSSGELRGKVKADGNTDHFLCVLYPTASAASAACPPAIVSESSRRQNNFGAIRNQRIGQSFYLSISVIAPNSDPKGPYCTTSPTVRGELCQRALPARRCMEGKKRTAPARASQTQIATRGQAVLRTPTVPTQTYSLSIPQVAPYRPQGTCASAQPGVELSRSNHMLRVVPES